MSPGSECHAGFNGDHLSALEPGRFLPRRCHPKRSADFSRSKESVPGIVPIPILQDLPQQTALVEVRIKFIDPPEKTLNISPDRNVFGRMDKISLDLVFLITTPGDPRSIRKLDTASNAAGSMRRE